jgi:hypothetical protein
MQLRMKSSDDQTYFYALLELNISSIKNALKCRCYELLNNYFNHETFQSNSKNDDENETAETV